MLTGLKMEDRWRTLPPNIDPSVGDWLCQCGNWNWSKRHSCNKCGAARIGARVGGGIVRDRSAPRGAPPELPPGLGEGLTGLKRKALIAQSMPSEGTVVPVFGGERSKRPARPGDMRQLGAMSGHPPGIDPSVGDWACTCGNWNWQRRDSCNRCGASKQGGRSFGGGSAPRPGDGVLGREFDASETARRKQREAEARDAAAARKVEKRKCEFCHRAMCIC